MSAQPGLTKKKGLLTRMIRACQPISRTELAERLKIDKSTVAENVKSLIDSGILREDKINTVGQGRRQGSLARPKAGLSKQVHPQVPHLAELWKLRSMNTCLRSDVTSTAVSGRINNFE